jgi:hypothetical protein
VVTVVDVGIVVPTLGTRPDYLELTLKSIRKAGLAHICIVAPSSCDFSELLRSGAIDAVVVDPGQGLPAAINAGLRSLPTEILYTTWLGDDDLLEPHSITLTSEVLRTSSAQFVWGQCRYINKYGKQIWLNKSGRWALALMRVGPNLVPQPGSMFTRKAYNELGGLDMKYGWAFDQDLFTKIGRNYMVRYLPQILASFRWHDGSLSAGLRDSSVTESSRIRTENLPKYLKPLSSVWEVPVRYAIRKAGLRMNRVSH